MWYCFCAVYFLSVPSYCERSELRRYCFYFEINSMTFSRIDTLIMYDLQANDLWSWFVDIPLNSIVSQLQGLNIALCRKKPISCKFLKSLEHFVYTDFSCFRDGRIRCKTIFWTLNRVYFICFLITPIFRALYKS